MESRRGRPQVPYKPPAASASLAAKLVRIEQRNLAEASRWPRGPAVMANHHENRDQGGKQGTQQQQKAHRK